jgi:V8-like Glu-specific endopeptidase
MIPALAACGNHGSGTRSEPTATDDTTLAYQRELVAPLPRLTEKVLKIRDLEPAAAQDEGDELSAAPMPPQEIRGTEVERAARARRDELLSKLTDAGWTEEPAPGYTRYMFTDLERREESIVEVKYAELAAVYEAAERLGVSSPPTYEPPAPDRQVEPEDLKDESAGVHLRGWSNGTDNRVNKGISATYPFNQTSLRRIGQNVSPNGRCTGTLVGRRLVLMAAHCVVTASGGVPASAFSARRSGSTAPYGTENNVGTFWPTAYRTNGCAPVYGTSQIPQCAPHDWAIILLREDAYSGVTHPLWMGYAVPSVIFGGVFPNSWHNGYPGCGLSESPAVCVNDTLFGQTTTGGGVLPQYPDPADGNAPRYFKSSVDVSPGHSGGPYYTADGGSPVTRGIAITQDCNTCPNGDPYPNGFRAVTPALSGLISSLRSQFP